MKDRERSCCCCWFIHPLTPSLIRVIITSTYSAGEKQSPGCKGQLLSWHSLTRVLAALLVPMWTCTRSRTCRPYMPLLQRHLLQPVWLTVLELTCEQLLSQSIMSTVEALCGVKKRAACQNCDVKVPYSVSRCQERFLCQVILYVEVVTYSVECDSWH